MLDGKRQALAADFSAPWGALLARAGELSRRRILDVLTPTPRREPRLYLMEPYDPKREPLIMVHGLLSTPLTWAEVSNELWADPEIRQRYQIWHYLYNTSAPALYSARLLRNQLRELRATLDPEGDDPGPQRITLLAHSMGGLLSKTLVTAPSDRLWETVFAVSPSQLNLPGQERAALVEAFQWQPDPRIHRILFVAVPHRGSDFADNPLGHFGRWIAKPPGEFGEFFDRLSKANPGAFRPGYEELGRGRLDSIAALSPKHPTLQALADLPFATPVQIHSIIGDRGKPGPLEESSDGIVPYSSSHLAGADSELVVPQNHEVYRHPEAVDEIRRILRLP